ncbi:MAG: hypothetical protein ACERLG_06485 [Sedimentibacter sp.]
MINEISDVNIKRDYKVGKLSIIANGKALIIGETDGTMIKII